MIHSCSSTTQLTFSSLISNTTTQALRHRQRSLAKTKLPVRLRIRNQCDYREAVASRSSSSADRELFAHECMIERRRTETKRATDYHLNRSRRIRGNRDGQLPI